MIKNIIKLLNAREKKYFNFIFILLCINSIFELLSIAILFPTLSLLFNENYDFTKIDSYLNIVGIQVTNFTGYLYLLLVFIFIIFCTKNLFYFYFIYQQNKFVRETRLRLSNQLLDKYIYLSYPVFFKKTLPNILRNIDLSISFSNIAYSLILLCSEIMIFCLLIIFLLNIEFKLTLIIIAIIFLLIIIFKDVSRKKVFLLGVKSQKYAQIFKKEILQTFYGIREIKILKKENFFNKKFNRINKLEAQNNFIRDLLLQVPRIIIELMVLTFIIVLIFTMYTFEYEKSEIMIFISLVVLTSVRLMPSTVRIIASLQKLRYSEHQNEILMKEITSKLETTKSHVKKFSNQYLPFKKEIVFTNVSFSYELKKTVIDKLNLKIKKNSCFGIIGESGSGKSTITDLIMGLLKPTSGEIKIDNNILKNNINIWQNSIGYVSQSPFFLNDTLEKNIAFGLSKNKINKKLVIEVSKRAQIFEHIDKLKNKFKTNVGEGGINFSGGQLQRIAIARALYRKSDILILDEATNSLDSQSELMFFKFLKTLKKKLTIIIISHKAKNLNICDQVLKIKKM